MEPSRGGAERRAYDGATYSSRARNTGDRYINRKKENHNHHLPVSWPVRDEGRCDQHTSTSHSPPSLPSPGMFFKAILTRFLAPDVS